MWHPDFLRHRGEDRLSLITQTGEGWTLQSAAIFPLPLFMISASSSSSLLLFTWHLMAGLIDFKHLRWLLLAGGSRTGVDHRPASSAGLLCFRGNSISNGIFSSRLWLTPVLAIPGKVRKKEPREVQETGTLYGVLSQTCLQSNTLLWNFFKSVSIFPCLMLCLFP